MNPIILLLLILLLNYKYKYYLFQRTCVIRWWYRIIFGLIINDQYIILSYLHSFV